MLHDAAPERCCLTLTDLFLTSYFFSVLKILTQWFFCLLVPFNTSRLRVYPLPCSFLCRPVTCKARGCTKHTKTRWNTFESTIMEVCYGEEVVCVSGAPMNTWAFKYGFFPFRNPTSLLSVLCFCDFFLPTKINSMLPVNANTSNI